MIASSSDKYIFFAISFELTNIFLKSIINLRFYFLKIIFLNNLSKLILYDMLLIFY